MDIIKEKNRFTDRLISCIPSILEHHFRDMNEKGEKYKQFLESNRFLIYSNLTDSTEIQIKAIFINQVDYQEFQHTNFQEGYVDGEMLADMKGIDVQVLLELSENLHLNIYRVIFEQLDTEIMEPEKRLFIMNRLIEIIWTRFNGFILGYLSTKNRMIDYLHNQKVSVMGQMAAGMAHEIRNPVTSIKGFLQIMEQELEQGDISPQKWLSYLKICKDDLLSVEELVSHFLILARKKESSIKKLEPVQINSILNRIHELIRHFALEKNVNVVYFNDLEAEVWVEGVSSYIEQIFLNIIKNGIDSLSEGGTVTVSVRNEREEQEVVIAFVDDGVGIPEYLLNKVFDPFFTTKEKGTGMGLAICKQLIEEMNGTILISSVEGKGTTVEVRFKTVKLYE